MLILFDKIKTLSQKISPFVKFLISYTNSKIKIRHRFVKKNMIIQSKFVIIFTSFNFCSKEIIWKSLKKEQ